MINPQNSKAKLKKPMKKGKKIVLAIAIALLSVAFAVVVLITSLLYFGKRASTGDDVIMTPTDNLATQVEDDNTVTYNGKKYKYNSNISTILCIGVDNTKRQSGGAFVTGRAGQADAIYLIVTDTSTSKIDIIGIPRDSMVDIDIYSSAGTFIGSEKKQICLSFAYGDGKHKSAENTAKAVSRFLYGMPVNSYFAVDDKTIEVLHNAVGNMTVIPNETIENYGIKFYKDQPFTVTGSNAFAYLQSRNDKTADASLLRLERQTDYLQKYFKEVIQRSKNDITFPVKLYNKISKNAITDINVSKITYHISSTMKNKKNIEAEFVNIKGEQTVGENSFAEFYPDENELFETVLSIFYKETE